MPNAFRGIQDNEHEVHFESFNALYFDIRDEESGDRLHIKRGSEIALNIPVSSTNFEDKTYFWQFRNGNWHNISPIQSSQLR